MTRRTFISTSTAALAAASGRLPIRKAVLLSMLPKSLSMLDRFKLAVDCGFEQIECPTTENPGEAEQIKRAADGSNLRIHSVMNQAHWKYPLSSGDPAVVALHACDGLPGRRTNFARRYRDWGEHFAAAGYVALFPDSFCFSR